MGPWLLNRRLLRRPWPAQDGLAWRFRPARQWDRRGWSAIPEMPNIYCLATFCATFLRSGWTPLFLRASAIVIETGGYLSHGSIVAREYGIPAVANVPGILDAVRDGERLKWMAREGP